MAGPGGVSRRARGRGAGGGRGPWRRRSALRPSRERLEVGAEHRVDAVRFRGRDERIDPRGSPGGAPGGASGSGGVQVLAEGGQCHLEPNVPAVSEARRSASVHRFSWFTVRVSARCAATPRDPRPRGSAAALRWRSSEAPFARAGRLKRAVQRRGSRWLGAGGQVVGAGRPVGSPPRRYARRRAAAPPRPGNPGLPPARKPHFGIAALASRSSPPPAPSAPSTRQEGVPAGAERR